MSFVKCDEEGCNCMVMTKYGHKKCQHCRPRDPNVKKPQRNRVQKLEHAQKQSRNWAARGVPDSWNV